MSEISNYDKVQNALKILNKKEINENDDSRSICNTLSDGWMQENEDSGSGKSKTVQSEKSQVMEAVHIKEEAIREDAVASTQADPDDGEDLFDASMVPSDDTGGEESAEETKSGETKTEPEAGDSKEGEGKGDDGGKGNEDGAGKGSNEGPSSDKNGGGDVDNYNNAQAATMVKALFDVILAAANEDLKAQVKVDTGGGNAGTTETEVTGLNNNNGATNQAASTTQNANANSTDTSTQTTGNEVPTDTSTEENK